ncbi:hypothetical protein [Vibrio sp. SCSIO 43136]|uniref:hypothetical protein n=1 Tax=Vibrio sp. SCSIO 43136 TaxID=2819101 RepID=UPI002075C046|nr:hypothetical protein [Vibrio sp. SCSIO 43136]USD67757.1 hypothetical protein J4N39_16345 [Vibrio sp. SCSIO 43136]
MINAWTKSSVVILSVLLSVTGCTNQPVTGTEAVLVPVTTELKLGYKSQKSTEKKKLDKKAAEFIVAQMHSHAEKIYVTANTKQGQQLQAKLKQALGEYAPWIEYKTELKARATSDLVIRSERTQVIMPPCEALGAYNTWSMQDGCFVDRARNKSLATPSTLKPVVSELSILED